MKLERFVAACLLAAASTLVALDWTATGPIPGASDISDLVVGPDSCLYIAANSADTGYVCKSSDGYTWVRTGSMPGYIRRIYALAFSRGDTLFAGTRATYGGTDSGHLYSSSDLGATWQHRSSVADLAVGVKVTALLEDDSGYIYAGHDYFDGSFAYPPCRSTDRGYSWTQAAPVARSCAYHYVIIQASDGAIYSGTWGYRGLVMKSTNHGASWSATGELFDAGYTTSLVEGPGGVLYACTYPKVVPQEPIGRVFKTTNQGGTWTELGHGYFDATTGLRPLCIVSDSELYVASEPSGVVFASFDWGTTWTSAGTLPGASVTYRMAQAKVGSVEYLYAATGQTGKVFRALLGPVGVTERSTPYAHRITSNATIVRGVLCLPEARGELLDVSGRKVLGLRPGANDVGGLSPGVYFVQAELPVLRRQVVVVK